MQGESAAAVPFSRGQDGPVEAGPNRTGPVPGRGTFPQGGRGTPVVSPGPRRPFIDPATLERRRINAEGRLRQQVSQLRIATEFVPERLRVKHQLLLKTEGAPDKAAVAEAPVHVASACMYSAIHSELASTLPAGKGADRAAFDAAVELWQRPQAAQWTRPSKHGNFILTSVQIMTNV